MKFHKHDVHPAIESGHADRSDTPVTDRMEAGEYSNYIPSKLFDPARAILARIK